MRCSAMSSRVKSCVSISTVVGILRRAPGRAGFDELEVWKGEEGELHRKTLPKDSQKEAEALGMVAGRRVCARSLSTVPLMR